MSCSAIPLYTKTTPPCQETLCKDLSANPATFSCVSSKYIFAEHYITKGVVLKGASGAYLPAITVCQMNIVPDHIGNAATSKSRHFGL